MKLTKQRLKQIIKEEMDGQAVVYPVEGRAKADPWRARIQTQEELYAAIQKASRILEDLPLEDLPEAVTDAAQNLRDVLDVMPQEEKRDPLTPGRADIYSYLNET